MGVLAIVMQLRSDTYLSLRGVPKWTTTDFDGLRVGLLETIWLRSRGAPQSFKASTCALGGAESHLLIGFCATQMSRSRYSSTSNNSKIQHTILYLQWRTNCKSYMICRTAPFSMTLNNLEWFSNILTTRILCDSWASCLGKIRRRPSGVTFAYLIYWWVSCQTYQGSVY